MPPEESIKELLSGRSHSRPNTKIGNAHDLLKRAKGRGSGWGKRGLEKCKSGGGKSPKKERGSRCKLGALRSKIQFNNKAGVSEGIHDPSVKQHNCEGFSAEPIDRAGAAAGPTRLRLQSDFGGDEK